MVRLLCLAALAAVAAAADPGARPQLLRSLLSLIGSAPMAQRSLHVLRPSLVRAQTARGR